jgi:molybdopterin converting factor small subunit
VHFLATGIFFKDRKGYRMKIEVKFFGGLDRIAGTSKHEVVEIAGGLTIKELIYKFRITEKHTAFFIVNGEPRTLDYILQEGDKIKIFPLIVGG